jgi:hypothetical protein
MLLCSQKNHCILLADFFFAVLANNVSLGWDWDQFSVWTDPPP